MAILKNRLRRFNGIDYDTIHLETEAELVDGLGALALRDNVSKLDVGLGNVDNTSDMAKPVSTATQTALQRKVNPNLLDNWYFVGGGSQQGGEQFPINNRAGWIALPTTTWYKYDDTELTEPQGILGVTRKIISHNSTYGVFDSGDGLGLVSTNDIIPGYIGTGYSIDRWVLSGTNDLEALISINPNYITITNGNAFRQPIENPNGLAGKTVTLSALVERTAASRNSKFGFISNDEWLEPHVSLPNEVGGVTLVTTTITLPSSMNTLRAWIYDANGTYNIYCIKLELGDTQTLAHQDSNGNWIPNEIPNFQEQLFRCQTSTADANDVCANMANTVGPKFVCNPNLLDNWYFAGGGSQQGGEQFPINEKAGYIVPPGTTYFTEGGSAEGVTSNYYEVKRFGDNNKAVFEIDGVEKVTGDNAIRDGFAVSGYVGDWRPSINRWRMPGYAEQIVLRQGYLQIGTGGIDQDISHDLPHGKYTATILTDEKILRTATVSFNGGEENVPLHDIGHLFKHNGFWVIRIQPYTNGIIAAKLEFGDKQTLAHMENGEWVLNEIPNYQEQLFRCHTAAEYEGYGYGFANQHNTVGPKFVSNPNLLDNAYFVGGGSQQGGGKFPINQQTGYIVPPDTPYYPDTNLSGRSGTVSNYTTVQYVNTAYGTISIDGTTYYVKYAAMVPGYVGVRYGIDRWYSFNDNGRVTFSEDGVNFAAGESGAIANFTQTIEQQIPAGTAITCSILLADGTFRYASGVVGSANPQVTISNVLNLYLGYRGGDQCNWMVLGIWPGVNVKVKAIKLESGDKQTLAHMENGVWVLNKIPNFQQELEKCQRYQIDINPHGGYPRFRAQTTTTSGFEFMIPIPVTLRKTPSAEIINADTLKIYNVGMSAELTGFTISAYGSSAGNVRVFAQKSGNTDTDAVLFINGGHPIFDANL